ncbi:MAG: transketolase [Sporomusaceae bacterium]|nr:transketolase [Sporomusaceae bacterium]
MDTIKNIRQSIVRMVHDSKSSHVGSCLSIVEILYVLYFELMNVDTKDPKQKTRDKLILSKGHASAALYATLAERGFFPKNYLNRFYVDKGVLPGHVDFTAVPGLEASAGSLGHGLSIGLGMAIANKQMKNPGHVFVILGDGECNEGSVWEAVMLAAQLDLSNLTAIVDFNKLQGFGRTEDIINQNNLRERWTAFGWSAQDVDGHDVIALKEALSKESNGPKVLIAHTVKGKGITFMEDKLEWHYKSPNDEEYKQAMIELGASL